MAASTTPDWIRHEAELARQRQTATDASAGRAIEDGFTIASAGLAFWQQLLEGLARNTEALVQIGFNGRISRLGEGQCQVEVSKLGAFPNVRQLNLFYDKPGSTVIRAHANTLHGTGTQFTFVVLRGGELGVVHDATSPAMNASQMAETIVKSMVNALSRDEA